MRLERDGRRGGGGGEGDLDVTLNEANHLAAA